MKGKLYGFPDMGRTGLGHSLLAWARCVVWCEATGATLLPPRWLRLRVGPYLRRERDKREYFKLFKNSQRTSIVGRTLILAAAKKTYSIDGVFKDDIYSLKFLQRSRHKASSHTVVFTNAGANNELKFFSLVKDHPILLRDSFEAMVKPKYFPKKPSSPSIGIHVRMGDFAEAKSNADLLKNNVRLPIGWYVKVLNQLRLDLGTDFPAVVYSDGSDRELEPLLKLVNVTRSAQQESVTDLLSIAQSLVFIGSGSGFSLWGAFLGQVPLINFPGRKRVACNVEPERDIESDGNKQLPAGFIAAVKARHLSESKLN